MSDLYDYINNSDLWKESGNRICSRRKKKNISSQGKLADLLNVGRELVIDWEKGHQPIIKTADLAALARILEVDPEYITCQCDTLRKENDNIVSVTGLSEKAVRFLKEENDVYSPFCGTVSGLIEQREFFTKLTTIKVIYQSNHFSVMSDILAREFDKQFPHAYGPEEATTAIKDWYASLLPYYANESLLYGAEYDLYMEIKKYIEQ